MRLFSICLRSFYENQRNPLCLGHSSQPPVDGGFLIRGGTFKFKSFCATYDDCTHKLTMNQTTYFLDYNGYIGILLVENDGLDGIGLGAIVHDE